MPTFRAKKIPKKSVSVEELLATFCFYFPHYSYEMARKLPYRRVNKMLRVARKERARQMIELAQVQTAGTSQKAYNSVISYFQSILED